MECISKTAIDYLKEHIQKSEKIDKETAAKLSKYVDAMPVCYLEPILIEALL
ncbi:Uncharacterised protein [uncultured archaeon]|nr:Uncharacterised protein [uncultured archaeon]